MSTSSPQPAVLVTGAGAGIGEAASIRVAGTGARVYALDRDEQSLERLRAYLPDVVPLVVDLADPEAIAAGFDTLATDLEEVGAYLSGLVCAAGVQTYGTVEAEDALATYERTFNVNVRGVLLAARHAVPLIRRGGVGGSIVVVSSVQAFLPQQGVVSYAATKGSLNAMVRAIALDHAHEQIRVNTVCPGSVDTPMLRWAAAKFGGDKNVEETVAFWGRSHPLGRVARAEEVAEVIEFLLSSRASFVTGSEVRVDGGLSAGNAVVLPPEADRRAVRG